MVKNWELMRAILLKLENSEKANVTLSAFDSFNEQEVEYNTLLLSDAGYIKIIDELAISNKLVVRLTNAGHDLLDVIRGDAAWKKMKAKTEANKEKIQFLLSRLENHDDYWERGQAARNLGLLGDASKTVVNALLLALKDVHWYVRSNAADSLGLLGAKTGEAINELKVIDALLDIITDDDLSVSYSVVASLSKLCVFLTNKSVKAKSVKVKTIKALVNALDYEDDEAAKILSKLGVRSEEIAESLVCLLKKNCNSND